MGVIRKRLTVTLAVVVLALSMLTGEYVKTSAVETTSKDDNFLIYQLQTGSPFSASSELISIVNVSTKPQRLGGLCLFYSAATSELWQERACFSDPDLYTQLWVVSGGIVYIASDTFVSENPSFIRDLPLSSSMAAGGGALKIEQNGVVIDLLGWGTSNVSEGTPSVAASSSEILERKVVNYTVIDSQDNNLDFVITSQGVVAQSGVFEVEIPRDICLNLNGLQESVPLGYETVADECYQDMCLNIEGLQITSDGYELDENGDCGEIELEDSVIQITELLPNADGVDDGQEFIELYNPNDTTINLKGYTLVAGNNQFIIDTMSLKAKSYIVFYDDTTGITLPNSSGVEVILQAPSGREVSRSAVYTNAPDDQSWSLISGKWKFSNQPTPGNPNNESITAGVGGSTSSNELAPCPKGKFRNPLTNRCKTIDNGSNLVPCDSDEYRNPLTNRCNKISSSSNTLKPCGPGQVRNPDTNRCRSISASDELEPCPEGKERNPETNRCRTVAVLASVDGSSGPALTATIVDVPAPSTGVNWAIISLAVLGSIAYIVYEWRVELSRAVASMRSYRYN